MGMGFSITTSNADTQNFINWMDAALHSPTYDGNIMLDYINIPVTMELLQPGYPEVIAPINAYDIQNSYTMTGGQFGLAMHAALTDPSLWSTGTLNNYNIGLSSYLNASYANGFNNLNPFRASLGNFNFKLNLDALGGGGSIHVPSVPGADDADNTSSTDQAIFNRKVKLISECGDYDEKISEIRKKMGFDYKKGIKMLDELMKEIDSTTLNDKANELYKEDFETRQENAASYSDQWAKQIANSTDAKNFKVNMYGVTKDNILDVLGNFITNEQYVQAGSASWKTLIENNFSEISKILISKAEAMRKSTKNDQYKAEIKSVIDQIKAAKTPQEQVNNTYNLFNTLRKIQAENNDKGAYERYGVPANKIEASRAANVATANYQKETKAYSDLNKLNTAA